MASIREEGADRGIVGEKSHTHTHKKCVVYRLLLFSSFLNSQENSALPLPCIYVRKVICLRVLIHSTAPFFFFVFFFVGGGGEISKWPGL